MSLSTKMAAAKEFASVIRRWPNDANKVFPSFREAELRLFEKPELSSLPSAETLRLRARAAQTLLDNAAAKKFATSEKLLHPNGKPRYYELIVREANQTSQKIGAFTVIKDTAFGWWK